MMIGWLIVAILILIVFLAVIPVAQVVPHSLYRRLGGVFAIAAIIDTFSDRIVESPIIGRNSPNPYLRDWYKNKMATRMQGLKFMRTLWLCSVSGGDFKFTPSKKCPMSSKSSFLPGFLTGFLTGDPGGALHDAHAGFHMTQAEFNEASRILGRVLDEYKVGPIEKEEVRQAFDTYAGRVVTAE